MNVEQLYPVLAALAVAVVSYLVSYFNNKKLKNVKEYPFQVIDIEDKSTITLVIGHSLNGIFKLNLSESLPHVLIGASTRAGKSRLIKIMGIPIIQYDKVDNKKTYYLPLLRKENIKKEKPIFYLKIKH